MASKMLALDVSNLKWCHRYSIVTTSEPDLHLFKSPLHGGHGRAPPQTLQVIAASVRRSVSQTSRRTVRDSSVWTVASKWIALTATRQKRVRRSIWESWKSERVRNEIFRLNKSGKLRRGAGRGAIHLLSSEHRGALENRVAILRQGSCFFRLVVENRQVPRRIVQVEVEAC